MPSFKYGTRVIENEQQVRLEKNVKRIGNWLQAIVRVFVTFLLFVLINALLSNLVQHTQLTFVKMMGLVQESAEMLLSHSAMSALYLSYQHTLSWILAIAFICVYEIAVVVSALNSGENEPKQANTTFNNDCRSFDTENVDSVVSYRHKVCFLS